MAIFSQQTLLENAIGHLNAGAKDNAHLKKICDYLSELEFKLQMRRDNEVTLRQIIEAQDDKLRRRNMQIKDLKEQVKNFGIGHLSMNNLIQNAIELLKSSGYKINR